MVLRHVGMRSREHVREESMCVLRDRFKDRLAYRKEQPRWKEVADVYAALRASEAREASSSGRRLRRGSSSPGNLLLRQRTPGRQRGRWPPPVAALPRPGAVSARIPVFNTSVCPTPPAQVLPSTPSRRATPGAAGSSGSCGLGGSASAGALIPSRGASGSPGAGALSLSTVMQLRSSIASSLSMLGRRPAQIGTVPPV